MSKGSKQTGTQTVTQVNPTAEAQLPYLQESWNTAQSFYNNPALRQNYFPYSTVAPYVDPNANLAAGYQNLIGRGQAVDQTLLPVANQGYTGAVGGGMGVQNSPAYGGYQQFAQSQTAPQAQLASYGAQAAANNNIGLNSLMGLAQGQGYSNPWLSQAIQGAIDPLVRNYQTAIAPGIDAAASQAGRYGSGAQAGMVDTAQQNLARGIGNVTSSMQNAAYEAERGRQLQAASQGGQLYNQGLSLGLTAAEAAARAQQFGLTGLQGGYQSGNAATLQALGYMPQFLQAQYSSPLAQVQGGQGLWGIDKDRGAYEQQLIDAYKARYDYQTKQPWTELGLYQQAIGGALTGSQTTSQPIYGNPTADALAGLTGGASLARNLGLFGNGGIGSLFGSTAGGLTAANLFGAGPAIAAFNAAPAAAALPVAVAAPSAEIASIFGLAAPFVGSDRRLKEDDQVVGLLGDLPIHSFRYKGDAQKRIGFMADEVEKIDPGAVVDTTSGYKAVNYGRAAQSALNSFMR
jgi:hypothetical protein